MPHGLPLALLALVVFRGLLNGNRIELVEDEVPIYTKLGTNTPSGLPSYGGGEFYYNESTGMEYNVHELNGATYLAACHSAVGLVTWYLVHDVDAMYRTIEDESGAV